MKALKGFVMFGCILQGIGCGVTVRFRVSVSFVCQFDQIWSN